MHNKICTQSSFLGTPLECVCECGVGGCRMAVWVQSSRLYKGSGVHTCPPTGRGSCRATAQTTACGRSCWEPSWCYAVAGGDWTVASVLWQPTCTNKHMKNIWQINKIKNNKVWRTLTKAKSMVQTLKRRGILERKEMSRDSPICFRNTLRFRWIHLNY